MRARMLLLALAIAGAGCGGTVSDSELDALRQAPGPPMYWVGTSFAGLRLTHAEGGSPGRRAFFGYGECDPGPHGGCPIPIQIQHSAPFSPAKISKHVSCARTTIRGVPAAMFDGLDVYTRDVVVRIYARSTPEAIRVAKAMRPINRRAAPGGPLPPPPPETERALGRCSRR
ncbi:MAG: hypothetical protein ABR521_04265 [Gaiellaceae bacterium]